MDFLPQHRIYSSVHARRFIVHVPNPYHPRT